MSQQEKFNNACKNGHLKIVKELLKNPHVNPSDDKNRAIRSASLNGHLEVVKELLKDSRVDPSDKNNWAISCASLNGHLGVVKELLKDSRVDPSDDNNWAIRSLGFLEVVKEDSRVNPIFYSFYKIVKELTNNMSKKHLFEEMNFILDIEEQITSY